MFGGQLGKDMMIKQGYVPPTCTLPVEFAGPLIWSEINKARSPCDGCNGDRLVCGGKPKSKEYDHPARDYKKYEENETKFLDKYR